MMISHRFVVISGVPGSGKSTVGRALAEQLDISYLDKDEILESLFNELECSNEETRHRLSREADQNFQAKALGFKRAVLDSFWRHPLADTLSGTPSSWLTSPDVHAVEVLCDCSPGLAATRFLNRKRHTGHLDNAWTYASLVAQSEKLMRKLPLGVGALVEIDTTDKVDLKQLAAEVRTALNV
ncbi:MAG: AAA family ATPase [Gammaproteobacteria bacterium]|nr:AAA family ATPase [Gammaproteobacteria bacterium]